MRILVVGAGASFSTKDVETGYFEALSSQGHEMFLYALDHRIETASKWMKHRWTVDYKKDPRLKPTWNDVIYRGGIEALEMALRFQVDWVFVVSAMYFHPDVLVMMKRAGLKVSILFTESPYEDEKQARVAQYADVCFTNERTSVEYLQQANPNTFYLKHAYAPLRHQRIDGQTPASPVTPNSANPQVRAIPGSVHARDETEMGLDTTSVDDVPSHDIVFVGSGFQERLDLLKAVDWTGIDVGLYGTWTLLPKNHKLRQHIKAGIVSNTKALQLYWASKIGLNLYRTSQIYTRDSPQIVGAESLNPRAYELAASGTFCITDFRPEGLEVFGDSQPTLMGAEDLRNKILYYLSHPDEREALAIEALRRVRGNTFDERAMQVVSLLAGYELGRKLVSAS